MRYAALLWPALHLPCTAASVPDALKTRTLQADLVGPRQPMSHLVDRYPRRQPRARRAPRRARARVPHVPRGRGRRQLLLPGLCVCSAGGAAGAAAPRAACQVGHAPAWLRGSERIVAPRGVRQLGPLHPPSCALFNPSPLSLRHHPFPGPPHSGCSSASATRGRRSAPARPPTTTPSAAPSCWPRSWSASGTRRARPPRRAHPTAASRRARARPRPSTTAAATSRLPRRRPARSRPARARCSSRNSSPSSRAARRSTPSSSSRASPPAWSSAAARRRTLRSSRAAPTRTRV